MDRKHRCYFDIGGYMLQNVSRLDIKQHFPEVRFHFKDGNLPIYPYYCTVSLNKKNRDAFLLYMYRYCSENPSQSWNIAFRERKEHKK